MADSTMVICKFHHHRVHRASFLVNLNTYPTQDNCWNTCGICHSRNSIRVHRVRLAVKKKLTPPPTQGKNRCGSSCGQRKFSCIDHAGISLSHGRCRMFMELYTPHLPLHSGPLGGGFRKNQMLSVFSLIGFPRHGTRRFY